MAKPNDVVVKVPPAVARAEGGSATMKMSTAIWVAWWRIADEHAEAAREQADYHGELLGDVMHEAMVSIVASASALGGFAASIRRHSDIETPTFGRGVPPEAKILETLKCAASLGSRTDWIGDELTWLFDLRDPLVHPGEELREPVQHLDQPKMLVSVESSRYSAKNAERGVNLIREVVRTCRDSPKPPTQAWFTDRVLLIGNRLGGSVS
jgi:hypothetical protein